ncbi:hypothetical protein [Rahnella ecdela]|uniref:Peptidase C39-like domain-containing protein n=1 Tax=Rahnella ecdela TaxID=2816250 RepID=A0ABS6LEI3_9GAMM|nr:hypothetical protein [Rahnella ecdela]MBU9845334.1 hypothetical protein [Rahnella ecdela]
MFETFTLQQPAGGNACGAFALAALLNARNHGLPVNTPTGAAVYNDIIAQQNALPAGYPAIFTPPAPRSLPSSLVRVGIARGFNDQVQVMVNQALMHAPMVPLIVPETTRIGHAAAVINSNANLQGMIQAAGYYLALVHNGDHWIALGRNAQGFYAYDSDTNFHGAVNQPVGNRVTLNGVQYDFSGILICF